MKSILACMTLVLAVSTRWVSATADEVTEVSGDDWQRTIIFIQKEVADGQFVFLRGGIDADRRDGCTDDADTDACAIPIRHSMITGTTNTEYNDWSTGDDYLDWYGVESGQGTTGADLPANGTPLVWTTNDATYAKTVAVDGYGYTPFNTFGEHCWMMDVEMDCSEADGGWFEFKGFGPGANDWEPNVDQDDTCAGEASDKSKPYDSNNHFAKCGHLNKCVFNHNGCEIDSPE